MTITPLINPKIYPAYDDKLTEVYNNSDPTTVNDAIDRWQKFGTTVQDLVPCQGMTGSGSPDSDGGPKLSVNQLISKYLTNWTGPAAQEFLTQAGLIGNFGYLVGAAMYDAY